MQILSLFPECSIAVTDKDDGGIVSVAQLQDMLEQSGVKLRTLIIPTHQHSTNIIAIDQTFSTHRGEVVADGLMTDEKGIGLAHRVADCCPIVILDRRKRVLMTLHAGWRGMTLGLVGMGILSLQAKYRSSTKDLWMWIGPCIQKASYLSAEVPLQLQFFPWKSHIHVRDDGFHVDLPGFAFDEARRMGIDEDHIINDGRDTYEQSQVFFSHQRAVREQNVADDQRFSVTAWLVQ
jgi:YfiH family protein